MHYSTWKSGEPFSGATIQTVNARELHAFLGVSRDFNQWMREQIERARLVEGRDYLTYEEVVQVPHQGGARSTKKIQYAITLDAAKHIGMMSGTDKGFEVREYFIACERRAQDALPNFADPAAAAIAWAEQYRAQQVLAVQNAAQAEQLALAAPKVAALDRIARETEGATCLRITAKLAQVPEKQFLQFMQQEGWITRHHHSNTWMGYSDKEAAGLLELKRTTVTRDDGSDKVVEQVLVTPRGLAELIERKAPWLRKVGNQPPSRRGPAAGMH